MTTEIWFGVSRSLTQVPPQERLCHRPRRKTSDHRIVRMRFVRTKRRITERSLPERCSLAWHGTDRPNVEAQHMPMMAAERIVKKPPPRYIVMPTMIAWPKSRGITKNAMRAEYLLCHDTKASRSMCAKLGYMIACASHTTMTIPKSKTFLAIWSWSMAFFSFSSKSGAALGSV